MNNTVETLFDCIQKSSLTDREKFVITERLLGKSLKEIGLILKPIHESKNKKQDGHLNSERVRQIEAKACRKLQHPFNFGNKKYIEQKYIKL